jgi:hypothetical protein
MDGEKYHNTCVKLETYQKLKVLARKRGKTMNALLAEIIDPIFQVAGINFKNFEFETMISVLSNRITFDVHGRPDFVIGTMPESELQNLKDRMFEKVKEDVEKAKRLKKQ